MLKLYIFNFEATNKGISWYWAKNKEDAEAQARADDEAKNIDLLEADSWTIDEAVHKNDIKEALNRYIIKPLNK